MNIDRYIDRPHGEQMTLKVFDSIDKRFVEVSLIEFLELAKAKLPYTWEHI